MNQPFVSKSHFQAALRLVSGALLIAGLFAPAAGAGQTRPSTDGEPINAQALVFVLDVDEINSADQAFAANVFYAVRWNDPREAHTGSGYIQKPLEEVWHPHIQIINQQRTWETLPPQVLIKPSGDVTFRQRVWGYFSQPLRLHDFPFDQQDFSIQFVAANMTNAEITFSLETRIESETRIRSGIAENLSVADWTITDFEVSPSVYKPMDHLPGGAGFQATFSAKRQSGYYIIKVIIPLVLIVMMSWVVFWIDPTEAGSQIGVAMTAMLTLIAYRFAVGTLLPKVSYLTRMDWFILLSTMLVFASMLEVITTATLAKRKKLQLARGIDNLARGLFPLAFLLTAWGSFY